ncbi:glycoside hydrolase family 43 protein [Microbulbifer hainanensis]|uniref:glycoside hydrolase family 43 protein n=1 Tax=Microbulbifer hainanensis TaxID=2735675 RepID=UPI001868080D|nr:glycoside hydrolase family 43 protein [Microbulbifer hainanensis]
MFKINRCMLALMLAAGASLQQTVAVADGKPVTSPRNFASAPLVTDIYTADPSAHAWDGKLFIYPSHDIATDSSENNSGEQFAMRDYHVLSMDKVGGRVRDNGVALSVDDVPWAKRQMWAPDAARKNGKYFLYFPAKDEQNIFRIGVAVSDSPTGPFVAQPRPIPGSYSIDPAVFADEDGEHFLYLGGIWGGQLQRWQTGKYTEEDRYPTDDQAAIAPMVAKLSSDMLGFAETPRKIELLNPDGTPIRAGQTDRRFFEAAWMHKYNDTYYFSYSTGDTHNIVYATGDSPYGPFTYRGVLLKPVLGWTNHHSIAKFNGQWYLFYHDAQLSGGQTHLRNVKMLPLTYNADGSIQTLSAFAENRG